MKKLIKIGLETLVLPASANVNALLETLSQCVHVRHVCYNAAGNDVYAPETAGGRIEVSVRLIDDAQVLSAKAATDLARERTLQRLHPMAVEKVGAAKSSPAAEGGAQ